MNRKLIKYTLRPLWVVFVLGVIGIPSVFLMVKNDAFGWFGSLPSLEALERPDPDLSSELMSADGVSLGKYFRKNRTPVTYEQLSPELVNTLLVTEDVRFKDHSGIDLKGLARAIIGKLTFSFQGGGSTLTMQLAENLFKTNTAEHGSLYRSRTLGQIITKLKEWIIAVQLEKSYTKEEILAMYLNTVEFGSNSYGIKVAAKTFFNKLPSQLNYSESAVLVGAINAPTRWSPVLNPENAHRKRTEVLWNLHKYGLIDKVRYDTLNRDSIQLNYRVENQNEGLATYFRTVAKNYLVRWARQNGYDLFDDGLKIYTTIDSRLQQYAEEAVAEHMDTLQHIFNEHWQGENPWIDNENKEIPEFLDDAIKRTEAYKNLRSRFGDQKDSVDYYLNKKKRMTVFSWGGEIDTVFSSYDSLNYYKRFLQAGFMSMDPRTGYIKAWVGGINHQYFKFDHVQQSRRQPGSTFKPIVYTAAIDNGYSPCFPVVDAPVSFSLPGQDPPTWVPQNSNGRFTGEVMTIRQAMAQSVNSITAFMMNRIGPSTVVDYAKRLGIESRLDAVPSLCLGAGGDVSIYEMVGAYSTFVNKGTYIKPYFISRIEDKNGNVIQQFVPDEQEAINEETAYLMLHMLKGVVEMGTGRALDYELKVDNEIGAKTGTTQNASDGWFIGVTKDLVSGAWVGGDDRSIRFRQWVLGQGGRTALPIWEGYMQRVYADETLGYEKGYFEKPTKPLRTVIDCERYEENTNPTDTVDYDVVDEDDFM
ncbi:penicillin-binding protein 1A [Ekhidna lutea]|uniref:Penicillin-binding protein 1A n=1 Tax=Ekhidna lutea TaxID=447679 RepID=A0A239FCY8_EKHLU|nr:transglycosylase domain-containing protein [Ekhidna lutea]SNS53944.1 penicillin-binding protein 1A [Ekhidna lutea]